MPDRARSGFWAMMVFLTILVVGFVYEWKKGATGNGSLLLSDD